VHLAHQRGDEERAHGHDERRDAHGGEALRREQPVALVEVLEPVDAGDVGRRGRASWRAPPSRMAAVIASVMALYALPAIRATTAPAASTPRAARSRGRSRGVHSSSTWKTSSTDRWKKRAAFTARASDGS
jgi:hypothetical protein